MAALPSSSQQTSAVPHTTKLLYYRRWQAPLDQWESECHARENLTSILRAGSRCRQSRIEFFFSNVKDPWKTYSIDNGHNLQLLALLKNRIKKFGSWLNDLNYHFDEWPLPLYDVFLSSSSVSYFTEGDLFLSLPLDGKKQFGLNSYLNTYLSKYTYLILFLILYISEQHGRHFVIPERCAGKTFIQGFCHSLLYFLALNLNVCGRNKCLYWFRLTPREFASTSPRHLNNSEFLQLWS